jgi:hypothetical protein
MGSLTPSGAAGPRAGLGFGGLPTGVRAVIALLVIGSLVEFYRAGLAFVRAAVGVVVKDPSISAAANLVDGIVTLVLAVVILALARALARGNRRARIVVLAFLVFRLAVSVLALFGGGWPLSALVTIGLTVALITMLVRGPARDWFNGSEAAAG